MEENNEKNTNEKEILETKDIKETVKEQSEPTPKVEHNFKTVSSSSNKVKKEKIKKEKAKIGFGKSVLVPFISGVAGCAAVLGVVLYVPEVKNKVFPETTTTTTISTSPVSSTTPTNQTNPFNNEEKISQINVKDYSNTSVYVANKVLPSIVGIKVDYTVSSNYIMFGSTTTQKASASATGSGIIISEDGYILTNNHIVSTSSSDYFYEISEANKVTVTLYNDKTEYDATIIGKDEKTDLAVLKINKTGLTKAEFADSDSVKVGEFAMAVGNPLGMNSSITCGVVSAINREITDNNGKVYNVIQTDAAINSGNSGGALVNSDGKVIGINTLKLFGNGIEGMGFAIPINSTEDITKQLIQYNKVKRPYIGINGVNLDKETADKYDLVIGVYIKKVEDFSAAEKAGLQIGDIITEVDNTKITTIEELDSIKNNKKIGDEITLKINRSGKEKEVKLTLSEEP